VGLSEFSQRQAGVQGRSVFALLAVDGLALDVLTQSKAFHCRAIYPLSNVFVKQGNPFCRKRIL
jgi:hypothetical protein